MKHIFKKYTAEILFFVTMAFMFTLFYNLSKPNVFFEEVEFNGIIEKKYRRIGVKSDLFDIKNFNNTDIKGVIFDSYIGYQLSEEIQ